MLGPAVHVNNTIFRKALVSILFSAFFAIFILSPDSLGNDGGGFGNHAPQVLHSVLALFSTCHNVSYGVIFCHRATWHVSMSVFLHVSPSPCDPTSPTHPWRAKRTFSELTKVELRTSYLQLTIAVKSRGLCCMCIF